MNRILVFGLLCLQISCISQEQKKINGVSFVAAKIEVAQKHVDEILELNANNAAVMPFGFIENTNSPKILFNTDRQWFGETKKGTEQYINMLHKNGVAVLVKPQIWIWRGEYTGTLEMKSEEEWKQLEDSYRNFIITYAKVAEQTNAEIFCIGTELEKFVENRQQYWIELINEIRQVYSGKLTYAANWDEFSKIPFWQNLDYIGVDAYFPLSEKQSPTLEELKTGWRKWKVSMEKISKQYNKPVLFTEFGYRSMDYTAKKPWLVDRNDEKVNFVAQVNATQVIIDEFWSEDWFAGGYLWKWFIDHKKSGGANDNRFTPQNKPAEETIRVLYKKY
tara:strand:+ start:1188 stop:2189 length:1002 start_codon:yes stop_codon:yes gene_type:complete